jgi:hypothetical protein
MLEKLPHKPEVLTEEQVRNILNELKSYRDKKIEFKDLSLAAKKMMHNSDQYLNTTIESLEKECKIFDDINEKFETLSKEKIKLEQNIATLESEYQTLENEHERRDRAGGGRQSVDGHINSTQTVHPRVGKKRQKSEQRTRWYIRAREGGFESLAKTPRSIPTRGEGADGAVDDRGTQWRGASKRAGEGRSWSATSVEVTGAPARGRRRTSGAHTAG